MPDPEPLPSPLAVFIRQHITSLEHIEILGVLVAQPGGSWTAAELAGRIGSAAGSIAHRLQQLVGAGVAACSGEAGAERYAFVPADPERDRLVRALIEAYRSHRLSVTNLVYGIGERGSQISSFADSFRIRPEDRS